jgi:hypothetical protein
MVWVPQKKTDNGYGLKIVPGSGPSTTTSYKLLLTRSKYELSFTCKTRGIHKAPVNHWLPVIRARYAFDSPHSTSGGTVGGVVPREREAMSFNYPPPEFPRTRSEVVQHQ